MAWTAWCWQMLCSALPPVYVGDWWIYQKRRCCYGPLWCSDLHLYHMLTFTMPSNWHISVLLMIIGQWAAINKGVWIHLGPIVWYHPPASIRWWLLLSWWLVVSLQLNMAPFQTLDLQIVRFWKACQLRPPMTLQFQPAAKVPIPAALLQAASQL